MGVHGDGTEPVWMVHEGLRSFAELGFGLILGKPYEVAVELLPNGLSLSLSDQVLHWESLACSPVVGFLVGLIYSQTCLVCAESTSWKTSSPAHNSTCCTDGGEMSPH